MGVIHSTKRPYWKAHYAEKLRTALFLLYNLRSAGLIGGRNSPAAALGVVRSMIWQTMDYGRATARSLDGDHAGVRKKLEAFQISVLREVLGLSKSAPKLAVFGESGDLPDAWRERRKQMSIAFQMITAESSSVAHRVAMEASSASPKVGLFLRVSNLLAEHDIEARDITDFKNKTEISNWIARRASTEWKEDIAASTRLIDTYAWTKDLRMRGYLKEDFKGRQILTKIRADDLELGADSYRGKGNSKADTCMTCQSSLAIETRDHFLIHCPALLEARERHPTIREWIRTSTPERAVATITPEQRYRRFMQSKTSRSIPA